MVDCKFVSTLTELNFKKLCGSTAELKLANPSEYRQHVGALMFLLNSCPDICFAVNMLSQFMVEHHGIHWIVAKNLLRYFCGKINYRLIYIAENLRLHGYTDVDWAGSVVDQESTSGCCFSMGSASISWMSRKQKSIALSTAEVEYIATKDPVFLDLSKHIDIRYHFIRDMVQWGAIRLQHISIDEQVAKILTKPLGKAKFLAFRERLGVMERPSHEGPT
eukprot:PITA_16993